MAKSIVSGQRVRWSARTLNNLLSLIDKNARKAHSDSAAPPRPGASIMSGTVMVFNTGSPVDRGGVLGIDDIYLSPDDNESDFLRRPILSCSTPTVDDHEGCFVVAAAAIGTNCSGPAYVAGMAPVKVNLNDPDDCFADVSDNENGYLESADSGGAQILWNADVAEEAENNIVWALVRIGGSGGETAMEVTHRMEFDIRSDDGNLTFDSRDWRLRPLAVTLLTFSDPDYAVNPNESFYSHSSNAVPVRGAWYGDDLAPGSGWETVCLTSRGMATMYVQIDRATGNLRWSWTGLSNLPYNMTQIVRIDAGDAVPSNSDSTPIPS